MSKITGFFGSNNFRFFLWQQFKWKFHINAMVIIHKHLFSTVQNLVSVEGCCDYIKRFHGNYPLLQESHTEVEIILLLDLHVHVYRRN